ncbi:MAG: DUF2975 domain-containing protein [Prevotella sp.]|nr:DUF2975 domain-containing protein [Prevotella sp.]
MKKKLNLFCVLMLLLLATDVVMTFVTGADDFAKGWEEGRNAGPAVTWPLFLAFIMELVAVAAAIAAFACFLRFILNVNQNKVFVWDNVPLLRITGVGLLLLALVAAGDGLFSGSSFVEVYDNYFDILVFSVFNLIVAEVFSIGLKLKEEQDLTI